MGAINFWQIKYEFSSVSNRYLWCSSYPLESFSNTFLFQLVKAASVTKLNKVLLWIWSHFVVLLKYNIDVQQTGLCKTEDSSDRLIESFGRIWVRLLFDQLNIKFPLSQIDILDVLIIHFNHFLIYSYYSLLKMKVWPN